MTPRERRVGAGRQQARSGPGQEEQLARGLGWFSIGLGLAEVLAPKGFAKLIGARGKHTAVIRSYGLREIAVGIGILTQPRPTEWVWARVAGDVVDLASLGASFAAPKTKPGRLMAATAAVIGVTALDVLCAQRLSRGTATPGGGANVEKSITINRPPEELYRLWRDPQNKSRVMGHFAEVTMTGDAQEHWMVHAPGGQRFEWDARIVEERPGEFLRWQSTEGAQLNNEGSVSFRPAPADRGTVVTLRFRLDSAGSGPDGLTDGLADGLAGSVAKLATAISPDLVTDALTRKMLHRFKALVETGEIPATENQPAARDGGRGN